MYKILTVARVSLTNPLFQFLKIPDPADTEGLGTTIDFTGTLDEVQTKVEELLKTMPQNSVIPVEILNMEVDVLLTENA